MRSESQGLLPASLEPRVDILLPAHFLTVRNAPQYLTLSEYRRNPVSCHSDQFGNWCLFSLGRVARSNFAAPPSVRQLRLEFADCVTSDYRRG
jgi:hypothetical protein